LGEFYGDARVNATLVYLLKQRDVLLRGVLGVLHTVGVFAQIVQCDEEALLIELARDTEGCFQILACDEAFDESLRQSAVLNPALKCG
jgi:hypothetical protein